MQVLQDERIQIDTAQAPRSPPVPEAAAAAAAGAQLARHLSRPLWIIALCALGVALHLAREALIPLILAILLALVLSGLVESLRRWQIPRGVSATLLLISAGVVAGAAVDALAAPAQEWMRSAPRVMRVIEHRVRPAQALVQRLNELAGRAAAIAGGAQPGPEAAPAGTPAAAAPLSAVEILAETGWLAGGVVTVVVLTLLILSAGPATLARMMSALNGNWQAVHVLRTIDAIRVEVGRYYGTLALINLSLGIATGCAMWALHMPNPLLWGVLAAVLNFVPYLGSAITLVTVSLVALVSFDSIPHALLVAATYLGLATIEGQLVEPIFFGRRLQLNPIVVFIALWLGGWLWGVAGVAFALPVLLAIKVAASRSGAGVVLRVLGPAISSLEESEPRRRRIDIASALGDLRRAG